MKYALIGCGGIAIKHIQAAIDNNLELTAICDIDPDNAKSLLAKCNIRNSDAVIRYTDYRKMLSENDIDIIAIATGSGTHAEIALSCIDKGINTIIEKPIALSIVDADKIMNLAEHKKVKVSVCHPNRFNLSAQKTRSAVKQGLFGRISHGTVHIRWNRNEDYYSKSLWRGKWSSDGGALMNQCIHGIDLLRWMMDDEIEEVYGVARQRHHDYIEAEDLGVAVVNFKNGSVATVEGTVNVYPSNLEETLFLFGEKGTVKLNGKSMDTIDIWNFEDDNEVLVEKKGFDNDRIITYGKGHTSIYADMIDAIKNDRVPYINANEGKKAVELVLAIYKSQKEGKPVKMPLKTFSTVDMVSGQGKLF